MTDEAVGRMLESFAEESQTGLREEMRAALADVRAAVEAAQATAQRAVDMAQQVSESHDQNRRELNLAAQRATALSAQLEQNIGRVEALAGEWFQAKRTADATANGFEG